MFPPNSFSLLRWSVFKCIAANKHIAVYESAILDLFMGLLILGSCLNQRNGKDECLFTQSVFYNVDTYLIGACYPSACLAGCQNYQGHH